jgi:hypothetical protein
MPLSTRLSPNMLSSQDTEDRTDPMLSVRYISCIYLPHNTALGIIKGVVQRILRGVNTKLK